MKCRINVLHGDDMKWKIFSIGTITEVVTKGTTPKIFSDSGVNYIKAEALNGDSSLEPKGFYFIDEKTHESLLRSQLKNGDVLLTIAGAQIGKCGYITESLLPANTNQAVGIMRPDQSKAVPKFVYYFFKQKRTFKFIQGLNAQAAQPNINLTMLKQVKLPLPSLATQKKIASTLYAYDDLIENNQRRIQLLEESARLLYKEWFVHLRFPGHEQIKITDGVPEGWKKEPLGKILTLQRGFDLPTQKRKDGIIPIYASTGINGYHNQAKVNAPGVVTGRSGSLGKIMFVQENFWPLNTTLWVKQFKKATPIFAMHLLAGMHLEQYNGGAAVPTLNRNNVHRVVVLTPDEKLMDDFERIARGTYQQIDKLGQYNKKLSQARDLLLPRLMNGDIEV